MAHIQLIGVAEEASPDGKIWKFPYAFPVLIRGLVDTKHTFDIIDTHLNKMSYNDLFTFVKHCKAKIYGISAWSHNYLLVKHLIILIRDTHPDAVIIVGGIIGGNSRAIMENTDADIVSTAAEGERVLPEILDALDDSSKSLADISGITYRDRSREEVVVTELRPFMSKEEFKHWSGQPIPVYDYFHKELTEMVNNINSMTHVPVKGFPLVTMRGCPFQCTFCGFLTGQTFLRLSWPAFFDELELLIDNYGVQGIYSYDTNMFLQEKEINGFCDIYSSRGHTFKSAIELRPTFGSPEMFQKLRAHGVEVTLFGIEHGSQEMLDRMKKVYDANFTPKVYQMALDADLTIHGNLLFGTPGETPKTVRESRSLMMSLEKGILDQRNRLKDSEKIITSGYGWSILIPGPPSELYETAMEKGYITNEDQYLESMADEENTKLLEGSHFKIALMQRGGDVNMSDFSSNRTLISYVHYNNAYIKLRAFLLEPKSVFTNPIGLFGHLRGMATHYLKYAFYSVLDKVKPDDSVRRRRQVGPNGITRGSDWTESHPARKDWPTPWSDAYVKENRNRGLVRLPFATKTEEEKEKEAANVS